MDTLTLTGPGGQQLTLFAPRPVQGGGLEAHAFVAPQAIPRPRTLKHQKQKYRVPAVQAGFYIAHIVVLEAR